MTEPNFRKTAEWECDFRPMIGRRVATTFGVMMALAIAIVAGYRLWLRKQIDREIAEIRKAGLPVTLAELNNWYKAVPPRENAGVQLLDNFYIVKPASKNVKIPIVDNRALPKASEAWADATKDQIIKYLDSNSNGLQVLHQAVQWETSRYPIDLNLGAGTLLPHLSKMREASNLLQLTAALAAETGNHARAVESVLDQLRLARTLRQEPVMISQIVRLRVINDAVGSVERIASILSLSTGDIDRLSEALLKAEEDLADCWQRLMLGERSMGIDIFQMPLHKVMQMMDDFDSASGRPLYSLVLTVRKTVGIWDADYLFFLTTIARANNLAARNYPEAIREAANITSSISPLNSNHTISALLMPNFENGLSKLVGTQAVLREGRLALAIEKYRAKTERVPENLQQLVPEYLKNLPLDPGNGAPFRYIPRETGYTLRCRCRKRGAQIA